MVNACRKWLRECFCDRTIKNIAFSRNNALDFFKCRFVFIYLYAVRSRDDLLKVKTTGESIFQTPLECFMNFTIILLQFSIFPISLSLSLFLSPARKKQYWRCRYYLSLCILRWNSPQSPGNSVHAWCAMHFQTDRELTVSYAALPLQRIRSSCVRWSTTGRPHCLSGAPRYTQFWLALGQLEL